MINLHNHSYYSWDALTRTKELAEFAAQNKQSAIALTDHGTVSGLVEFYESCQKQEVKSILGNEFYISAKDPSQKDTDNRKHSHLVILAYNKIGYLNLLKLSTESFRNFYHKPRLSLDSFKGNAEGLICINGHIQSPLSNPLFFNWDAVNNCEDKDELESYIDPEWPKLFKKEYDKYKSVFGDNLYVEIQAFDPNDILQQTIAENLRKVVDEFKVKTVATGDSHYISPKQVNAHQALNCIKTSGLIKNLPNIGYLKSGLYTPLTTEQFETHYRKNELEGCAEIVGKCEHYEILSKPKIPHFPVPDGIEKEEFLKSICREGWKKRIKPRNNEEREEYKKRFLTELKVLMDENLSDYFLIVHDYIKFARDAGMLIGCGRGSVGGSLTAYLMDIIDVDPIQHGLIFERFYSTARRGSLPDIDTDFPASRRHEVIDYAKKKYGEDKVCGVATFSKLQGRNVLKDVLRVFEVCDFKQANDISSLIPPKEKITDKLEEFRQDTGSESIIDYSLREYPGRFKEYVYYDDEDNLQGDYAKYFEIAIQLEGCIRNTSRHASAIIISDAPIIEHAPLINDKNSDEMICAYDMYSFEKAGLVKYDMLALKDLDCLETANRLIGNITI